MSNSKICIAIVEDDSVQETAISSALEGLGDCHSFGNADLFFAQLGMLQDLSLIILDWCLPETSGLTILQKLRTRGIKLPILFLTSRNSEYDIVTALNAGADDYLVKPFRAGELLARVKSLLRRGAGSNMRSNSSNSWLTDPLMHVLSMGVVLDRTQCTISMPNQAPATMTQREFDLACFLFTHINQPVSRESIMEQVWCHIEIASSRTLDTHISKVRNKLNLRPELGWRLTPVYSFGYRLDFQEI